MVSFVIRIIFVQQYTQNEYTQHAFELCNNEKLNRINLAPVCAVGTKILRKFDCRMILFDASCYDQKIVSSSFPLAFPSIHSVHIIREMNYPFSVQEISKNHSLNFEMVEQLNKSIQSIFVFRLALFVHHQIRRS